MNTSVSALAFVAVLTLSLFIGFLSLSFWRNVREDRSPLWLAAWLFASMVLAFSRLLQYAALSEPMYIVLPRILLTAAYTLAWLGYELGNSFIGYRPRSWERALVILLVLVPISLLWKSNFILTEQVVLRTLSFGEEFHGVQVGPLYLPINLLILALGAVPLIRLLRSQSLNKRENRLMAMGLLLVILFSLNDSFTTALSLTWIRLSDYSYLPVAIFFSYIQVKRFGRLFGEMTIMVQERTAALSQANENLQAEIKGRERSAIALYESEAKYRAVVENANDGIMIIQNGIVRYANPRLAELRGETAANIINQPFDQ